ncbi:metal ABC transporter permease [Isoalcanivorax indicus]|uniref:metal ABC transporter permease n=1 Tax=Isoalcanivorax indicus TaxID=2202653 RepID=UPI001B85F5B9|nr:metal ABC transporter permease [Isoalcanivorax indicus]
MDLLFEPMFRVPFVTGLLLALLVPVIGVLARLRDEWLAALGFAHLAGAGGALGSALSLPVLPAALGLAMLGVIARALWRRQGNDLYALLILAGWATMMLTAAVSRHASTLGQMLVDGQLYFVRPPHLVAAAVLLGVSVPLLPRLMRLLLRLTLLPHQDQANGIRVQRYLLLFNLILAISVALSAITLGVMTAFALLYLPAWIAYGLARSWRTTWMLAAGIGVAAYLVAFVAALLIDLPFGPVMVATLCLSACLRFLPGVAVRL